MRGSFTVPAYSFGGIMGLAASIIGALTAIATLAKLADKYIPMLVESLNNLATTIHDNNAIQREKLASQKAVETGDTSGIEGPLHGGKI
jgi:hypothetical protein